MTVQRRSLAAVHIIAQEHIVMLVVGCVNVISCPCLPTPTYHTMLLKSMQFPDMRHTTQFNPKCKPEKIEKARGKETGRAIKTEITQQKNERK